MSEVLVVDDDPVALEVATDALRRAGFSVSTAVDWATMNDALYGGGRIAAVLLDVNLPGLKGDTLADIVQRNLDPPPRIVLHSSIEAGELRRMARRVRATNFVEKGKPAVVLVNTIRAAVHDFEAAVAAKPSSPGVPPRPSGAPTTPPSEPRRPAPAGPGRVKGSDSDSGGASG